MFARGFRCAGRFPRRTRQRLPMRGRGFAPHAFFPGGGILAALVAIVVLAVVVFAVLARAPQGRIRRRVGLLALVPFVDVADSIALPRAGGLARAARLRDRAASSSTPCPWSPPTAPSRARGHRQPAPSPDTAPTTPIEKPPAETRASGRGEAAPRGAAGSHALRSRPPVHRAAEPASYPSVGIPAAPWTGRGKGWCTWATDVVGGKIRTLRESLGLSVEELAERCDCGTGTITGLEAGEIAPSLAPLIKITRALGVRLGTLLDDDTHVGPVVTRRDEASRVGAREEPRDAQRRRRARLLLAGRRQDRAAHGAVHRSREPVGRARSTRCRAHEGEEFIYVLGGSIEVEYGKDTHVLEGRRQHLLRLDRAARGARARRRDRAASSPSCTHRRKGASMELHTDLTIGQYFDRQGRRAARPRLHRLSRPRPALDVRAVRRARRRTSRRACSRSASARATTSASGRATCPTG